MSPAHFRQRPSQPAWWMCSSQSRKANPNVWLRPTCFGSDPSPWWLFYTNSVTGTFSDDSPFGRVPSPVYRESYTSARDYFHMQGAAWHPISMSAEEVLGLIHQTNEPFMNDAVAVTMRGGEFLPLYLNPKYMGGRRWEMLAGLLKWSRKNSEIWERRNRSCPYPGRMADAPDSRMCRCPVNPTVTSTVRGTVASCFSGTPGSPRRVTR